MKFLIDKVDLINNQIIVGINDSFKLYGLTREAIRNGETQNFEVRSKEQIVIDDGYKNFFYHKFKGISYKLLQERGKKKLYTATASFGLVGYSESAEFDEFLVRKISNLNLPEIEAYINDIDYDSYKIISQETGKKDFDFHKYLFVVNYQILYKTDNCDETCP